jgi:hypothetical protein
MNINLGIVCQNARDHLRNGMAELAVDILLECIETMQPMNGLELHISEIKKRLYLTRSQFSRNAKNLHIGQDTQEFIDNRHNHLDNEVYEIILEIEKWEMKITPIEQSDEVIKSEVEPADIEISILKDFNAFTNEEQEEIIGVIASLLKMSSKDINIRYKREGSVKLTLSLAREKAELLHEIIKKGALNELGINNSKLTYSKLFEILFSLSDSDLFKFTEFARLEFNFLPEQDISVLESIVEIIVSNSKIRGVEEASKIIEDEILKRFYTGSKEETARFDWNHTKNRLTNVIRRFVVFLELETNQWAKDLLLLEYFGKNELGKNFVGDVKRILKTLSQRKHDFDQGYISFKVQELIASYQSEKLIEKVDIDKMDSELDNFYLENKLRLLVEQYNRHRIVNEPLPYLPSWIDLVDISQQGIGVQMFLSIYQMMQRPQEQYLYFQAKKIFEQHEKDFSDEYRKTILAYFMNQCIFYLHHGQRAFASEYIEIIRNLIKYDLFLSVEGLSLSTYSNTVHMALLSDELDWLEKFLNIYSAKVDFPKIETIENLYRAMVLFQMNKYEDALNLLPKFDYFQLYFKIIYDKLCIKLYYELDDPLLESKLAAFEIYLKRKKELPEDRKEQNLNFVKAVKDLIRNPEKSKLLPVDSYLILDFVWLEKKFSLK